MDDLNLLLNLLPADYREVIGGLDTLTEIVIDVERPLEVRHGQKKTFHTDLIVTPEVLETICKNCGEFGPDNRAGINRTLHRISRILTRNRQVAGLTCRVGRAFPGCVKVIEDLVIAGHSILLVGPPGVGKTTKLRDVARLASLDLDRAVVIVDTSNEIAGDGLVPHEGVGRSRRMEVPHGVAQYDVMIEAVENHAPQVIVVDEISTQAEVTACLSIAQRGVQLIATAHGRCLNDILRNPELKRLLGGTENATVGDATMRRRGLTNKNVTERVGEPCFSVIVEILSQRELAIHLDVAQMVDGILRGESPNPEERRVSPDGHIIRIPAKKIEPRKEEPKFERERRPALRPIERDDPEEEFPPRRRRNKTSQKPGKKTWKKYR